MAEANDAEWRGDGGLPEEWPADGGEQWPRGHGGWGHGVEDWEQRQHPGLGQLSPQAALRLERHRRSWVARDRRTGCHQAPLSLEVEVVELVPAEWSGDWLRECDRGEVV